MNDCADPHRADEADVSLAEVKEKARAIERFGRNTVLYLRDDFGRGNIFEAEGQSALQIGAEGFGTDHGGISI